MERGDASCQIEWLRGSTLLALASYV